MSDVLGTSSSGNTSQLDSLVASYIQSESPKLDAITTKKNQLQKTSTFYTGVNTRLNALVTQLDNFDSSTINDKFKAKSTTSSDTSIVTATSSKTALDGNNSIKVNRLASSDLLISERKTLADDFGITGTQTFDITVGSKTQTISIDFDGTESNEDALKKIVNAVNNVEDFDLTSSYVKDTGTTGRLTFTASSVGADNKISFADSPILAQLGLTNAALNSGTEERTQQIGSAAGFKIANTDNLNSEAEVNGILITRSSNTLSDVINGVDLTLNKVQAETDAPIKLETSVDVSTVKSAIQPLIDNFNILLNFLNTDKDIKRSEPAVSNLASRMRDIVSARISSTDEGNPEYLTHIGLKVDSKGNLSINDEDKLKKLLKENPQQVLDIFTSEDGFVKKIQKAVEGLQGDNGTIKSKTLSLAKLMDSTQSRYDTMAARIDKQGEALRKQYTAILKTYYDAQGQYSAYDAYLGSSSTTTS